MRNLRYYNTGAYFHSNTFVQNTYECSTSCFYEENPNRRKHHAPWIKTTDVWRGNGASGAKNQRGGRSNLCFYLTISCIEAWNGLWCIFWVVWGLKKTKQNTKDKSQTVGLVGTLSTQKSVLEMHSKMRHILEQRTGLVSKISFLVGTSWMSYMSFLCICADVSL